MNISTSFNIISEDLNKFYKNQKFYSAIRKYKHEVAKLAIQRFEKAGFKIATKSYNDNIVDKKDYSFNDKNRIAIITLLKEFSFTNEDISKYKLSQAIAPINTYKDVIGKEVYDANWSNFEDSDTYKKNFIKSLDSISRQKLLKDILLRVIKEKQSTFTDQKRDILDIGKGFFSLKDNKYDTKIELLLLPLEYKNKKVKVKILSDSEVLERGAHILNIKSGDKEIEKEINLFGSVESVIDMIVKSVKEFVDNFDSIEKKEIKNSYSENKLRINYDISKIFSKYLGTYFKETKKSGLVEKQLKSIDLLINTEYNKNKQNLRSFQENNYQYKVRYRMKKAGVTSLTDKQSAISLNAWFENRLRELAQEADKVYYRNELNENIKYFLNDEHLKFFKRVIDVSKRVVKLGYVPTVFSKRSNYSKQDWEDIVYTFSKKYYDLGKTDPQKAEQLFLQSKNYKDLEEFLYRPKEAVREEDLKYFYVEKCFTHKF